MAVTSGDNSNILIARVARETFGVERVVARIYDPRRAAIYERLGIATVATVAWTTRACAAPVLPDAPAVEWIDPTRNVRARRAARAGAGAGHVACASSSAAGVRVCLLSRLGDGAAADADAARCRKTTWCMCSSPADAIEPSSTAALAGPTREAH